MASTIYGPRPSRRRHPAQTPPFVPPTMAPAIGSLPSPVLLGGPGGEPVSAPIPTQGTTGGWWQNLINNPALATFAAGAAQRLLAPPQWGQTPTSQIIGGLLGGAGDVSSAQMMAAQRAAAARAEGREERKVSIAETAEERAGKEQSSAATAREATTAREDKRLGLEGRRVAASEDRVDIAKEAAEEARRKWDVEAKRAEKQLDLETKRVSIAQQHLNEAVRQGIRQEDRDRVGESVRRGTLRVSRARLAHEKAQAIKAAAEKKDMREVRLLELAWDQAAKETQAIVNSLNVEAEMTPEQVTERTKTRVDEIMGQMRRSIGEASTGQPGSGYTPSAPVTPGEAPPTKLFPRSRLKEFADRNKITEQQAESELRRTGWQLQ